MSSFLFLNYVFVAAARNKKGMFAFINTHITIIGALKLRAYFFHNLCIHVYVNFNIKLQIYCLSEVRYRVITIAYDFFMHTEQ